MGFYSYSSNAVATSVTMDFTACLECGALIDALNEWRHKEWHDNLINIVVNSVKVP